MQLRVAQLSDIDDTLALHYRYQIVSIADEDKKDGFVTTPFTSEELADLINYCYRLCKDKKAILMSDRLKDYVAEVQKTAVELKAVILLKGQVDVVCDAKRVKLNFTGNPGMTVGGTGDVLSGIIGALLAQKADPFEAAVAGAFVNGGAGDFVASEKGYHLVATDLLESIPRVLDDPMSHLKVRKTGGKVA